MVSVSGIQSRVRTITRAVRKRTTQPIFGNTLPISVNRSYSALAERSRRAYSGQIDPASGLRDQGFEIVRGVISPERARELSGLMTAAEQLEEQSYRAPTWKGKFVSFPHPTSVFGMDIFSVLDGNLDERLRAFFRSYYCIARIGAFRTYATSLSKQGSYLWHSDNFPRDVCKVMIYLTRTDAKGGGTIYLDRAASKALQRAGYDGAVTKARRDDIADIARVNGIPFNPVKADLEPGDAILFQPNCLHKGVAPTEDFRDVLDMMFLPSPVPWRVALEHDRIENLEADAPSGDTWAKLIRQSAS